MTFLLFVAVVALFVRVLVMGASMKSMQQRLQWLELQRAQAQAAPPTAPAAPVEPAPSTAPAAPAVVAPPAPNAAPSSNAPSTAGSFAGMAPVPATPREPNRFGRFLAEHALSLAGGAFVLLAAVLFLTFAINAGWIDETLRTVLAALLAAGLALASARVASRLDESERIGRAIGSLHGVLAGVAGAVAAADVVVASRRYDILDTSVAFVALVLIGAALVVVALRWRSQDLAALGLVGMLAAPIFVDAPTSMATLALVAVALVASLVAVVIADWPRLALVAVALTAPQLAAWAGTNDPVRDLGALLAVTGAWWLVTCASVVGPALVRVVRVRRTSVIGTVVAASFASYGVFEVWLDVRVNDDLRPVVVGAFAAIHIGAGLWLLARRRAELVGLAAAITCTGAALAAIAVFSGADGAARTSAFVAEAVGVSTLWWLARSRLAALSAIALGLLAIFDVLDQAPEPDVVWVTKPGWELIIAPVALLIGLVVAARLTRLRAVPALLLTPTTELGDGGVGAVRRVLDVLAWVSAWYVGFLVIIQLLTPKQLDSDAMAGAFALAAFTIVLALVLLDRTTRTGRAEAFALVAASALLLPLVIADWYGDAAATALLLAAASATLALAAWRRTTHAAWVAATGWLALLAAGSLLAFDGSPERVLARGVRHVAETVPLLTWLAALVAVAAVLAVRLGYAAGVATAARRIAAVLGVYVVSACVVRAFTDPPGPIQQDAQVALSVTWALLGLVALGLGIAGPHALRQLKSLRIGAYVLLGASALKVLLLDTSQLETPFRVAVLLLVGVVLLVGARFEQVLRSRAVPPSGGG